MLNVNENLKTMLKQVVFVTLTFGAFIDYLEQDEAYNFVTDLIDLVDSDENAKACWDLLTQLQGVSGWWIEAGFLTDGEDDMVEFVLKVKETDRFRLIYDHDTRHLVSVEKLG